MAPRILKSLGLITGSIIAAFIFTYLFAELLGSQMSYLPFGHSLPYILWVGLTITLIYFGRTIVTGKTNYRKEGWEPPAQIRDRVINQPQFVGRLDRERGLLETTARMVSYDAVNQPNILVQGGEEHTIIRFRGELLDQNGSLLEYIPVEVKAKKSDWVGELAQGDRIRVEGKIENDGILHSETLFNFSTNSWIGKKRS